MSDEILKQLAETLARQTEILAELKSGNGRGRHRPTPGLHTKAPAETWTATGTFQPGGIFSIPGEDRDVFTAMIRPEGLGAYLINQPRLDTNPRFPSITGFTGTSGDRPDLPCDDSPAGFMKGCNLTARFGRVSYDTQTIEWDKVKLRANRGVFDDLLLHGSILADNGFRPEGLSDAQVLNLVTQSEMLGAVVQIQRDLGRQLWQGVITVHTNGGFQEFPGLDVQIATGQVDADTNTTCPALDSDVKDFAYDLVCGSGRDIEQYLAQLEWYLRNNASKMGLMPATWKVCMTAGLWQELSACWPCIYNSNRCANAVVGTAGLTVMGDQMVAERDAMREGMYIDINGRRYDVVVDDGIFEHTNINNANLRAGEYASSIYFVPITAAGGFPVTTLQHVDYRAGGDDLGLLRGMNWFWSDDGLYSWAVEQIKWCYKFSIKTEQRVVLRTPQLAGRIDHIKYSPLQHLRDSSTDSPYWYDGGVSLRAAGNTYAVWMDEQR